MPDQDKRDGLVASGKDGGKPAKPLLPNLNVCGDIGLKIARDGTWYYQGSPIGRQPLVKLFSTVLRREDDGFYLVTPVEKVPIAVEGEPFIAVEMTREGSGRDQRLTFRTNVGDVVRAGKISDATSSDPLVQGVTIAPGEVRIQLAQGAQASSYVLENPFRIVFDVHLPSQAPSPVRRPASWSGRATEISTRSTRIAPPRRCRRRSSTCTPTTRDDPYRRTSRRPTRSWATHSPAAIRPRRLSRPWTAWL